MTSSLSSDSVPACRKALRVLFLGRNACEATEKALNLLRTLGCEITSVVSSGRGERLPHGVEDWCGDLILSFRSLFVLPKAVLGRASMAAVNFHPAPPEYPGSGCLNFALFEDARMFGVTAHLMNERVDNGSILECRRFPILHTDTVDTLLERTHTKLLDLFYDVVIDLVQRGTVSLQERLSHASRETWRGLARKMRDLELLQNVSSDVSEEHLRRVVRATFTERFPPYIIIHGYRFVLSSPVKSV